MILPGIVSSVHPMPFLLPLPRPLPTLGKIQWGFQLTVSLSGTYCYNSVVGADKPLHVLPTQLSIQIVSSTRKQSLGEEGP